MNMANQHLQTLIEEAKASGLCVAAVPLSFLEKLAEVVQTAQPLLEESMCVAPSNKIYVNSKLNAENAARLALANLDKETITVENDHTFVVQLETDENKYGESWWKLLRVSTESGNAINYKHAEEIEMAMRFAKTHYLNLASLEHIKPNAIYKMSMKGGVSFYYITEVKDGKAYGMDVKKNRLGPGKDTYELYTGVRGINAEIYEPFRLSPVAGNPQLIAPVGA